MVVVEPPDVNSVNPEGKKFSVSFVLYNICSLRYGFTGPRLWLQLAVGTATLQRYSGHKDLAALMCARNNF